MEENQIEESTLCSSFSPSSRLSSKRLLFKNVTIKLVIMIARMNRTRWFYLGGSPKAKRWTTCGRL